MMISADAGVLVRKCTNSFVLLLRIVEQEINGHRIRCYMERLGVAT